jgi:hypothetical protein
MPPGGKALRSTLKPPRCRSSVAKKELGLNPSCGSPSGYSPEEGDDENLDSGVYPCPSWNIIREEGGAHRRRDATLGPEDTGAVVGLTTVCVPSKRIRNWISRVQIQCVHRVFNVSSSKMFHPEHQNISGANIKFYCKTSMPQTIS